MRNAAYVILAIGGYALTARRLAPIYDPDKYAFHWYLTWLPFGLFIWWRLSRLTWHRIPRSLLFATVFSPTPFGVYAIMPLIGWCFFMGFYTIIDPVSRLLEYGVLWLGFILLAFLMTSIVAYALMPLWPFGRKAAPPNLVDQTTPGAETSERRKDRALIVGLTGLVVLLIVFTLALWEQREEPVHELERAHARATAVVAEQATTIANWRDTAIRLLSTPVAGYQGQSTPIPAEVPPRDYSYALPFSSTGTGPVTIPASEVRLFVFRPTAVLKRIEFVKSLTLHVTTVDSSRTGPTSINFTLWDFEDAWGSNRMGNQVAWGQNSIEIQAPDAYVGRTGEIYVEVRNYGGGEDVDLADLNFTLTVLNLDGTETVYAPTQ